MCPTHGLSLGQHSVREDRGGGAAAEALVATVHSPVLAAGHQRLDRRWGEWGQRGQRQRESRFDGDGDGGRA